MYACHVIHGTAAVLSLNLGYTIRDGCEEILALGNRHTTKYAGTISFT
jgi:hypothetical protein